MSSKYGQSDESKLENGSKWYFKDMRTAPIELGAAAEICGEYSSDEDEEISQSDLSYLAKSERKGYLLKRSNSDFNLWRRWYCVLMDQLWCVDIAREVPRAKCVKLSGMIRYREGYKTLDQLQIIIINSPDSKSHFFRAFNLIDQKKWIQDLNIKTRVASENDSFSMAEVIITDEEDAKNFRLTRQVGEVLDQPKAIEALAFRRAVDFVPEGSVVQNSLAKLTIDETADHRFSQSKSHASTNGVSHTEPQLTTPRKALTDSTLLTSPMHSPTGKNGSFVRIKQNINDPIAAAPVILTEDFEMSETVALSDEEVEQAMVALAGRNVSVTECTRFTHPRACSCVNLQSLEICERVENHCLMHELHKDSRAVTDVLLFVIAVQKYKEVLRRELYIPLKRQQDSAMRLYVKFILPQLLFLDLTQYPDFSDESMQLNSAAGAGEVDTRTTKKTSGYGTSGKFSAESPKRQRNRSQSQLAPEATAAASEPAVQWHIDIAVLMRVHNALFAMHARTVELRNALVTQDPSQLVKYGAGSSKFRARDRAVSTAHNGVAAAGLSVNTAAAVAGNNSTAAPASPVPAPAASFWPWFGFAAPSPGVTPPPSRKGSDAQALAAAASAKESAAAVAATAQESTSGKVSPVVVSTATVEKEKTDESRGESNSSTIPASPAASPSPQQTSSKSIHQTSSKDPAVSGVVRIEDKTEKPPSTELFDEVVSALLQKLN